MSRRQTLCADCFRGTLRGDVAPRGVEEAVHGLPTYVARPEPGGAAAAVMGLVVVLPDAYGWRLLNTRALADAYAARGPFVVYLPDFMDGESLFLWVSLPFAGLPTRRRRVHGLNSRWRSEPAANAPYLPSHRQRAARR